MLQGIYKVFAHGRTSLRTRVDLLAPEGFIEDGAAPTTSGIEVTKPWGAYSFEAVSLGRGIHALKVTPADAVLSLEISDPGRFARMELQAGHGRASYIQLMGGPHRLTVRAGSRPDIYRLATATFRRLGPLELLGLLFRRLARGVREGTSPLHFATVAWHRLFSAVPFGIRAGYAVPARSGVLTEQDANRRFKPIEPHNAVDRVRKTEAGPTFLVRRANGTALPPDIFAGQLYRRFHTDPAQAHDFVVTFGEAESPLPDALLLLAEHLVRNPDVDLVLADVWTGETPSHCVAWDPIFYTPGNLPTPHACRAGPPPSDIMTFGNQDACSNLSVPIATTPIVEEETDIGDEPVQPQPPCSIIIPTRDRADLLKTCLEGLFDRTSWPHEVIIVDNGSVEPATLALFASYQPRGLKVIRADMPFNFSALCNIGAQQASFDFLAFLNNDIVLHKSDWLSAMMRYAILETVGAVGARLLYPDMSLQHGGIAFGYSDICGHIWRGLSYQEQHNEPRLRRASLRTAVTAACLCVSRDKFQSVAGFDEEIFPVTLNDVDLCLKLRSKGWHTVLAGRSEAIHLESKSRGLDVTPEKLARRRDELQAFSAKWPEYMSADPYLTPAFQVSEPLFYR